MRKPLLFFSAAVGLLALLLAGRWVGRPRAGGEYIPPVDAGCAPGQVTRVAVIGDYGYAGPAAAAVASLVAGWNPDLIITTGDNNYPWGAAATIDENIGQYYHDFILGYAGRFGSGSPTQRFFPSPGNHDWVTPGALPYLDFFILPGNERYYDLRYGCLHLFALDTDGQEPDGNTASSNQAKWLERQLAETAGFWRIAYGHHPPYSSGPHGSQAALQWPFAPWGLDAVLAGHDHLYERLSVGGLPYFVNGLGGNPGIYDFQPPVPGSLVRYNDKHGAMLLEATGERLRFRFIAIDGQTIDDFSLFQAIDTVFLPVLLRGSP